MDGVVGFLHDERTILAERVHPVVVGASTAAAFLSVSVPLVVVVSVWERVLAEPAVGGAFSSLVPFLATAKLVGVVAGLCLAAYTYLRRRSYEYVITDRRVIRRSGIVARQVKASDLALVQDVTLDESVLGRILGYGDIVVESAGTAGSLRMRDVRDPQRFVLALEKARVGRLGAGARPAEEGPSGNFRPYRPYA